MKIGIYDPYLDDLGGGEKYMLTIAEVLSKKHNVSIFWDNEKDILKVQERFSLNLNNVAPKKNIFSMNFSFWKRIKETKKYDAIIFLSDGSIPFVFSKKLYVHLQQPLYEIKNNSLLDLIKLKRISKIFCNSQYTKSFNDNKLRGIETVVIYPPVEIFQRAVPKENMILHVGRFRVQNVANTDYKKQNLMVEEFKKMVDKGLKNWRLVIATSIHDVNDPSFTAMKKSAKGYSIDFLVNKSNDELWDTYNKAKIYWHASGYGENLREHPEYAEHFGISTVEAMGAGAVPVVINAGGQREIVTDGKDGFLWNTLDELGDKTLKLIGDSMLLDTLSKDAIKRSNEFSKEKFAMAIEQMTV